MSTSITRVGPPEPEKGEEEEEISTVERLLRTAIDGVLHFLPQIVIIILCVPILVVVSLVAGLVVRNSVPQPWERRVFLQYGESPIPAAYFEFPSLVYDQPYDITVHLSVPLTDANIALGNFMTYLTLTNAANKTVASAQRPAAILPRQTGLLRRALPFSLPLYTEVTVPILSSWTPGTSSPLFALLEIGRRDAWKTLGRGEGRELTVLEAYVRGTVLLQGTRRIVGRYPNLSGLFSSVAFFVTSGLGLLLCFYRFAAPFEGRAPRGGAGMGMKGAGMGAGMPLPPRPIPRTLEGRPGRSDDAGTPRGYVKREDSLSPSEYSTSGDLPTIPTPESGLLRQRRTGDSSAFVDVNTDEEGTVSI
ncbi:hypothetical protein M408DRAFT_331190 [Serendipita vermifera MAFF 305830]|uniref:Seipin n=1 Tax=Serendipita vermifera MAFF 305830 TaxID=933852 RepID=A0A0C2X850_SERVB|nr:hypothetical protein M408DRAFT_331190 [Serendipita vermifera MAFF 305830]